MGLDPNIAAGRSRIGGTVLVTGASGFVGSRLCAELSRRGEIVRRAIRGRGFAAGDCAVVSLEEAADWSAALDGVTTVLHLAARAHVRSDPQYFRAVNTLGTLRLAEQAAARGVQRFIFVSTIGVHGDETHGVPFRAGDCPSPANAYAVSKLEAEKGLWEIAARSGMGVVVVRPPLVYGGRAPGNFGALLRWLQRGLPIPVGAVDNHRSLVAVENLVDLLCCCVQREESAGQTFLVSDGEPISTRRLVELICSYMGQAAHFMRIPSWFIATVGELPFARRAVRSIFSSLVVDDAATRARLNWTPVLSTEQALRLAVETFQADQVPTRR